MCAKGNRFKSALTSCCCNVQFKDHLDDEAERSSRKLAVCRDYEQKFVQQMHEQNRQQLKIWDDKIQALEAEIDQECQRSSCVESDLCAAIEVKNLCSVTGTLINVPIL